MSYHTKMLTHYYALHFIWQGKPPTSFSVSQGNLTSRLFFHMQTPSFGSGPPPFAHRRPPWAPSSSAAWGHLQHRPRTQHRITPGWQWPPWARARRRPGATCSTDPPDAAPDHPRRQWPPWAPSSSAARGHPGRQARRRPGATSYTGRGERHRSLGSQIGMYTDKNRHHSPWVHWNRPTRAHQNKCLPP